MAKEFGEEFNKHIDQYLHRVVNQVREDVGKCWPMSQAYNATIVSGCKKILNPYVSFFFIIYYFNFLTYYMFLQIILVYNKTMNLK